MKKNTSDLEGHHEHEGQLASVPDEKSPTQTSPARRARRLRKSRDNLKLKIKEKQKKIKALEVKARDLGVSRETWKARAKQAEAKLKEAMEKPSQPATTEEHKKKPD